MPFDGSGNFNRVMNWVSDAAAGIKIVATRHDSEDDNLAAGLSNTLTKDGQSQPTANIPMNGKRLTNLGAPTAATDAATKAYADAVRTFNTAITLSGANPQARIGFTFADIGFGAREAGSLAANSLNRFVWNDKPDLSGVDVAMLDDGGMLSILGANMGFNVAQVTGPAFVAMSTGYGGWLQFNKTNGVWTLYGTAASVAGGATAVSVPLVQFNTSLGTVLTDSAFQYSNGNNVYHQHKALAVGFYRKTGVGNFSWNKSADGLQSGSGLTQLMALDDQGALTVINNITSSGNFIASGAAVVLAPTGAGMCYMRPNGAGSTTGQATLDNGGNFTAAGMVTSAQYFQASGANMVLGPTGAGTIYMRPNGIGSTAGQAYIQTSGNFTISGDFVGNVPANTNVASGFTVNTSTGPAGLVKTSCAVTSAAAHHAFYNTNGLVGQITTAASATTYATTSDERLKEFIGPYDPLKAIDIIRRDPVRDFHWKTDGSYAVGWGAQTSHAISPDLAAPPEDDLRSTEPGDENFMPWGIDQGKRTPYLWAALAWALDKVDDLEARLAALEAKA